MKLEMEARHFDAFFNEMTDHCHIHPHQEGQQDFTMDLPEHIGVGNLRRTRLRHGMEIGWSNIRLHDQVEMDVKVRYPHMELAFMLQGGGVWSERGKSRQRDLKGGSGSLIYMNDVVFHAEQFSGQPIDHMEIRIDFMLWRHLLSQLPWRPEDSFFCCENAITPHVAAIVEEMRNCPYTGQIRQLFLEGKCFELLAIHLHQAGDGLKRTADAGCLKREDIEALHQAKEILLHTWREPPSLIQLARKVGLNDFKLKSGFKELFGTTVFGFVRRQRMEEARMLLEQGRANVTEAAYLVGYSNISHFASQFHRTFGSAPGEYMRACRRLQ